MRTAPLLALTILAIARAAAAAPPTVRFLEPLDESVGRPMLHVHVTCDDGGGPCARIDLERGSSIDTVTDASSLDTDLAIPEGGEYLTVVGTSASQETTSVTHFAHGDTSARMVLADVVDAKILDADLGRILYIVDGEAKLLHRDDCSIEDLGPAPDSLFASLTTHGAIIGTSCDPLNCDLFEWRDGTRIEYGVGTSVKTAGEYILWSPGDFSNDSPLVLVDMSTGLQQMVAASFMGTRDVLGADGSVVYSVAGPVTDAVHRWLAGADVVLGQGFVDNGDGALTTVDELDSASPRQCKLQLYGDSGLVDTLRSDDCPEESWFDTATRSGWSTYPAPDPSGDPYVWVRSPTGVRTKLAPVTPDRYLEALADDGQVMFYASGQSVRASPTSSPEAITVEHIFRMRVDQGHWLIPLGRDLFAIDEVPPCPGGPCPACDLTPLPDAGVPDAGVFDAGVFDAQPADATGADTGAGLDHPGGGCGCRSASGAGSPWLAALAIALALSGRRRTRARDRRAGRARPRCRPTGG